MQAAFDGLLAYLDLYLDLALEAQAAGTVAGGTAAGEAGSAAFRAAVAEGEESPLVRQLAYSDYRIEKDPARGMLTR